MPAEPTVEKTEAEAQDGDDGPEIFYVCKKALQDCRETLKNGGEISEDLVKRLIDSEGLPDDEVMVPIDMRGGGDDILDDVEEMLEKLGAKGTAEALIKCADLFESEKEKYPEEERAQEMTAAEWRQAMEEDLMEEGEEEELLSEEEGEEEAEGEEDGEAAEPAAKKAKTS